jgi:hypothetical protein
MRVVNAQIYELALEVRPEGSWHFWCECGSADCFENVLLDLAAYSTLHDHAEPVLAAGHSVPRSRLQRRDTRAPAGGEAQPQRNRRARTQDPERSEPLGPPYS